MRWVFKCNRPFCWKPLYLVTMTTRLSLHPYLKLNTWTKPVKEDRDQATKRPFGQAGLANAWGSCSALQQRLPMFPPPCPSSVTNPPLFHHLPFLLCTSSLQNPVNATDLCQVQLTAVKHTAIVHSKPQLDGMDLELARRKRERVSFTILLRCLASVSLSLHWSRMGLLRLPNRFTAW